MKPVLLLVASLLFWLSIASGQARILTNDPLTGLPLIPPSDSAKKVGNEPVKMPDGGFCKSKMQGNFYKLYDYFAKDNIKLTDGIAWYTSHLSGFKKVESSNHGLTIYYNSDGTILVIVSSASRTADGVAKTIALPTNAISPAFPNKRLQV
ncbi:MAG: hypothetical protein WCB11_24595 [Terriglobales bacterium]|jgi:hypothetical protein